MKTYLLLFTVLFTISVALLSLVVAPSMYSDSGWGFLVWDSIRGGSDFNIQVSPDRENIALNRTYFMTTWTPAQYLFPGLFELIGLSLGQGIVASVTCFSFIGLYGWYKLYNTFGFSKRTVGLSIIVITLCRYYLLPYRIYNGGEVFAFAAAPWFYLTVIYSLSTNWLKGVILIFAAYVAAVFAKLSMLVFCVSVVPAIWILTLVKTRGMAQFHPTAVLFLSSGAFGIVFKLFWLDRGWTAGSGTNHAAWNLLVPYLTFSLQASLFGSLSLNDLLQFIFLNPSRQFSKSLTSINIPLGFMSGIFLLLGLRYLNRRYQLYTIVVSVTTILYIIVMTTIAVRGGAITADERFFRPLSLLMLVGFIQCILESSKPSRNTGILLIIFCCIYGVSSFFYNQKIMLTYPIGIRGFRHMIADHDLLQAIHVLDAKKYNNSDVFVLVPSPEIGLEFRNVRYSSNHADFESVNTLRNTVRKGRVNHTYVILHMSSVASGKDQAVLDSFVDYDRDKWKTESVGSFLLFSQSN